MKENTKEQIDKYYNGEISSQKLISFIKTNETYSNEETYCKYHNTSNICPSCGKIRKYSGFKNGYRCSIECGWKRKIKPKNEHPELTKELIIENVTKCGNISHKFLRSHNITEKDCFDFVFGSKNCKYCGIESSFINWTSGYKDICSNNDCKKQQRKERTQSTNLKRYGVKNAFQKNGQETLDKIKSTCIEKYGVDNIFKSKDIMFKDGVHVTKQTHINQKRNNTMFLKYGTIDPLEIKDGRKRGINKCINDPKVKIRRELTNLEKYGVDHPFKSMKFQDYLKQCNIDKFGVPNCMFDDKIREIHTNACIIRDENRLNDIDDNGLNSFERVVQNRLNDIDDNGLNSYQRAGEKTKETNIKNGRWIPDEEKTDFEIYYSEVWKYTRRQNINNLENIEKRGHANKGLYHLDHKFSIFEGFKQLIPAKIIGSICNLEMVVGRNNLAKGRKCSISEEKLIEEYFYAN